MNTYISFDHTQGLTSSKNIYPSAVKAGHEELALVEFRGRSTGVICGRVSTTVGRGLVTPADTTTVQPQNHVLSTLFCPKWLIHRRSDTVSNNKISNFGRRVPFLDVYEVRKSVIYFCCYELSFVDVIQHSELSEEIGAHAASVVQFQDLKHIELALKVLGLMCDGQYLEMQNYLREQRQSINSINMVGEVTTFLQQIFQGQHINPETLDVVNQLLQTLIEMSVGNYANQEVIFERQIMSVINHILQLDITSITSEYSKWLQISAAEDAAEDAAESTDLEHEKLSLELQTLEPKMKALHKKGALEVRKKALDLKASAVELLEAMLEETSTKTNSLALLMMGALDISAVHGCLVDFDKLFQDDKELKKEECDDNAERALYRSYHILMRLNDFGVSNDVTQPPDNDEVKRIWQKCKNESKSVEVLYKNAEGEQILTKVHFQFSPEVSV